MTTRAAKAGLELEGLVTVGRCVRAQGRRGEVAVEPLTDAPERFAALDRVYVLDPARDGECAPPLRIESFRMHKGRPVLKLAGISSIGEARGICGKELAIPESELLPLAEGAFYHFQLRGLAVADRNSGELGVVEDILSTGGCDLLVVRGCGGDEILVPFCEPIVRRVDPAGGTVEIEAPEGLVSLNAN